MQAWDLRSGAQLHQFTGHTGSVTTIAVAELNGRPIVISGSDDGTVRVWEFAEAIQVFAIDLGATVKTLVPTLQNLVVVNTPLGLVVLRLN
jgi:WD40 repeat protein